MSSDALIPDTAIILEPNDNPDNVRPNGAWVTPASRKDRIITIDAGDKLQYGGIIQLLDNYNVKHYQVFLLKTGKQQLLQVSSNLVILILIKSNII